MPPIAPLLAVLALLAASPDEVTPAPAGRFYAVEFRTGPRWDAARPPGEQAHFQDHSQNLKKLRQEGRILLGGRYSDKGFLVLSGSSEEEIRKLFDADPSVANQVFALEVHEFRPFYPGCVGAKGP